MATLQDRVLKLAQQEKKKKASKKGQTALVPDTSSSSPTQMIPVKRPRVEEHIDLTRDIAQKKFLLPPCFSQRGFFEDNLLTVSAEDSSIIMDLGAEGRRKVIDEGVAAVMRVLAMALVLIDRVDSSSQDLEKLRRRNGELKAKIAALRTSFADYKEQYQVQAGLVTELREKTKEVQDLTKSLESLKLEHAAEKKKLEDEIADLKAAAAPAKDESKEMKLMTRAQLVERIKLLDNDCIDGVKFGFDNAVAQIKVVNPEVEINIEGLSMLKTVEDGKLVCLANCASDSEDDDSDEDGPEVENGEDA
jgi:myosin heavy subunit